MSTTKAALITILLSTICGAVWLLWTSAGDKQFIKWPPPSSEDTTNVDVDIRKKVVPVVFAKVDIPSGSIIQPDALEERTIPQLKAPHDSFSTQSKLTGRVANHNIQANHIVLLDDVSRPIPPDEQ